MKNAVSTYRGDLINSASGYLVSLLNLWSFCHLFLLLHRCSFIP